MWRNFKAMPGFLKFLTFHAFMCVSLFLVSVVPRAHFMFEGRRVTYGEWWASGVGPLVSTLGLAMTTAGVLFLVRRGFGRIIYLAVLGGCLTVPFLVSGDILAAVFGAAIATAMWAYLFRSPGVRAYFTSNNSFKPKPLRGSA